MLLSLAAAEWHIQTVDSPGDVGGQTSLALDAEDHPHISYYDYAYSALKYAYWNGSYWETEIVDNDGWNGWLSTSLVLDSLENPHISYRDCEYQVADLKYAHWNGSSWVITTVDSIGETGKYSSLILDTFDNPHIAYTGYNGLRYASRSDTGIWVFETVDYAGSHTSLVLDSSEYPHIAYFDAVTDCLKYAYYVPLGIEEDPDVSDLFLMISPNPSNSAPNFIFSISETGLVELMVFDLSGRLVREFSADEYPPGFHNVQLEDLAPGIYFCKMTVGDFTATQCFVVID